MTAGQLRAVLVFALGWSAAVAVSEMAPVVGDALTATRDGLPLYRLAAVLAAETP